MKENAVYLTSTGIKNLTDEKLEVEQILGDTNQVKLMDENERQFLKERLRQLEQFIENVSEVPLTNSSHEQIQLGSIVQLYDLVSNEILEYMLVDHLEANPIEKKLSIQSPVGQALLSKKAGDVINLTVNNETLSFEIKKVRNM